MRKICAECKTEKPFSEFSRRAKSSDGHRSKCKACTKIENSNWYLRNRKHKIEKSLEWQRSNPEKMKVINARGREKRKDYYSDYNKEWYKNHKDSPDFRERARVKSRNRIARMKLATPSWISAIEFAQMQEFYDLAKAQSVQTGRRYEVDHIIPLGGKLVSGLHVPWNLQILSEEENLTKATRIMGVT